MLNHLEFPRLKVLIKSLKVMWLIKKKIGGGGKGFFFNKKFYNESGGGKNLKTFLRFTQLTFHIGPDCYKKLRQVSRLGQPRPLVLPHKLTYTYFVSWVLTLLYKHLILVLVFQKYLEKISSICLRARNFWITFNPILFKVSVPQW